MNKLFIIKYNTQITDKDVIDIIDINIPILREFNAFHKFTKEQIYKNYNYSGIVSPKFTQKTGLSREQAIGMIDDNYDIILYHPYPLELKLQNDFLHLAELEHPGIKENMQKLWEMLYREHLPVIKLNEGNKFCVHSNFFIANTKFWEMYSQEIYKIVTLLQENQIDFLLENTSYNLTKTVETDLAFFPFVFERYLTHYLYKNKDKLRIKNISLEPTFKPIELFKCEKLFINLLVLLQGREFFYTQKIKNVTVYIYFIVRKTIFKIKRKEV